MVKCPTCQSIDTHLGSKFCHECGAEMSTIKPFVYDQLFELMKFENERRLNLDTKANTYIGLLTIAITLFVALGGLLTIENIEFFRTMSFGKVSIMYILYILIIIAFLIAATYAFKAYHIGSPFIPETYVFNWDNIPGKDNVRLINFLVQTFNIDWARGAKFEKIEKGKVIQASTERNDLFLVLNSEKTKAILIADDGRIDEFMVYKFMAYNLKIYHENNTFLLAKSGKIYLKMNYKLVLDLLNPKSSKTRDGLISQLGISINVNSKLNLKKSNNIIIAFYSTMVAIGLLFVMTIYISIITLGILR